MGNPLPQLFCSHVQLEIRGQPCAHRRASLGKKHQFRCLQDAEQPAWRSHPTQSTGLQLQWVPQPPPVWLNTSAHGEVLTRVQAQYASALPEQLPRTPKRTERAPTALRSASGTGARGWRDAARLTNIWVTNSLAALLPTAGHDLPRFRWSPLPSFYKPIRGVESARLHRPSLSSSTDPGRRSYTMHVSVVHTHACVSTSITRTFLCTHKTRRCHQLTPPRRPSNCLLPGAPPRCAGTASSLRGAALRARRAASGSRSLRAAEARPALLIRK